MPEARWWVISGAAFQEALRRANDGEDPDGLYIEFYANSDVEHVDGGPRATGQGRPAAWSVPSDLVGGAGAEWVEVVRLDALREWLGSELD